MTLLNAPVTEQDFSLGSEDASVTLVEYGDYDCPHCRQAYAIVEGIQRQLGERLRFVYRPFPRGTRDSPGIRAAEAALAAGAQGRFWEMHGLLLDPHASLAEVDLLRMPSLYRAVLGLDEDRFTRELTDRIYDGRVREYMQSGVDNGVRSTPTFFINGRRHDDYWDADTLLSAIEQAAPAA
ncbi:MAG: Periplasmic thiol:disulfide interchange protein DsbA [Capsulimonas sp.]|nr:Periplasmic thiol:disulfide interchange protein DsbA [Capsulimonas sp.]